MNRICVAIGNKNLHDALTAAKTAAKSADVVEVRLDLIKDAEVRPFMEEIDKPLIFTNRPSWEGGKYEGTEEERTLPLIEAMEYGAAYVDLELAAPPDSWRLLAAKNKENKTRIIGSWHDFQSTPLQDVLEEKVDEINAIGADIGKIVTMARNKLDSLRVLSLLKRASEINFPLIVFSMGEFGSMSRVATCALGGYMTYCAADIGEAVAPGQIAVSSMRAIFSQLQ